MLKENKDQPRFLCLVKMPFKTQCEIKRFLDKIGEILHEQTFMKKILQGVLQAKEKESHWKNKNTVRNEEQEKW